MPAGFAAGPWLLAAPLPGKQPYWSLWGITGAFVRAPQGSYALPMASYVLAMASNALTMASNAL